MGWLQRRRDDARRRILDELAFGPGTGLTLGRKTGMGAGRVTQTLFRLETAGEIVSYWETPAPTDRPRRRFYTLASRRP
jgi:DNA-binding PadR family transcriptional regulator